MPREIILYNPERSVFPTRKNGYTIKLKYEAMKRANGDLDYEIHHFKSRNELEQQLQAVFTRHRTERIDKLIIHAHGDIEPRRTAPPEGVMSIKPYAGDMIGQQRHGRYISEEVTATELSAILRSIQPPPTKIPELRLICCNSGLLSVRDNLARTFLRSDLFNYVVGEDMAVSMDRNLNIFKVRMSFDESQMYFDPFVEEIPNPNQPTAHTETFLRYCAPGNRYRSSRETVVFYHYRDPTSNVPVETWRHYPQNGSFTAHLSGRPGHKFPGYVQTPKSQLLAPVIP